MGILHLFPSVFASKINIFPSLYLCFFIFSLSFLSLICLGFQVPEGKLSWQLQELRPQATSHHSVPMHKAATAPHLPPLRQIPSTLTLQPSVSPSPNTLSSEPPGYISFTLPYSLQSSSQVKPR